MIHVKDLAGAVASTLASQPQNHYIIAVDDTQNTLDDILRSISEALGTRVVKKVSKEDALTKGDITQADYDSLLITLRLDAPTVKELSFTWHCQTGLLENMTTVIAEYKKARNLEVSE